MLAKKCDICGALYEAYNYTNNVHEPSGIMLVNARHDGTYYEQDVTDCCPKCMAAIMDTIKSLSQTAPELRPDEDIGEW